MTHSITGTRYRRPTGHSNRRAGFTLTELVVSSGISLLVVAGLMAVFLWSIRSAYLTRQSIYGQTEARVSAAKMVAFIRTAKSVSEIDEGGAVGGARARGRFN